MDDLIARVAAAIEHTRAVMDAERDLVPRGKRERYFGGYRERLLVAQARAAVLEIRSPSKAMLNAACAAMSLGKRPTDARVSVKAKHGIRYRAMIDAALLERDTNEKQSAGNDITLPNEVK